MKIIFPIMFLALLSSCTSGKGKKEDHQEAIKTMDLPMPNGVDTADEDIVKGKNSVSVVLLSDDGWWCYTGTDVSKGAIYDTKKFQQLMLEKKKEFGNDLAVIIKPTKLSTHKATVDILDQMTTNDIKRYAIYKISKEEENYFNVHNSDLFSPPQAVKKTTPNTITSDKIPQDNSFLIEIKKDNSVWYQFISPLSRMSLQKVDAPITKNLTQIIADYKLSSSNKPKTYLIKGDKESTYPIFKEVVDALKENNIHNYTLVTTEI